MYPARDSRIYLFILNVRTFAVIQYCGPFPFHLGFLNSLAMGPGSYLQRFFNTQDLLLILEGEVLRPATSSWLEPRACVC